MLFPPAVQPRRARAALWLILLLAVARPAIGHSAALSAPAVPAVAGLPVEIEAALARTGLPREALSAMVLDAQDARAPARLAHRAQQAVNPASLMKLVTSFAALEQLGPAYVWQTPVYLQGSVQGGVLHGTVFIVGRGDPKLVSERLWLLMRRLQGLGIREIAGDIVLDRTAFELPAHDPASFDDAPLRPYNAAPDALLINYQSSVMQFTPDPAAGLAHIQYEPPLAGVQRQTSVALAAPGAACGDWRAGLRADLADPQRTVFSGNYPAACGERVWPVAAADPQRFAARAIEGMWRSLGGTLAGSVRAGTLPAGLQPAFVLSSAPLAELLRDVNKYSNNLMAQQLFLTLALEKNGVASFAGARQLLRQWWQVRMGPLDAPPEADNGAGLSRSARLTAQALARMLQLAWASPLMPELLASLPIAGVDGTLRRSPARAAHLKTGSLRDVLAIAGYVHAASGRRYVLVAIVNHANASAAAPLLEALIDWTARD